MTYTSDQQLSAMGLRPLEQIPNREGFRLILRTRDGENVSATVRRHTSTGLHFCYYEGASRWGEFVGWKEVPDADNTLVKFKAGTDVVDTHLTARRARTKI
jgi:hypothetical protein